MGRPEDASKVAQVKEVIRDECGPSEERCLYQSTNLGIRHGPPTAISWFFDQVDEGIILEDDCIPGEGFFSFVQWALDTYRDNERVKLVSGFNRFSPCPWPESCRFVKTSMIWGWASWRRAWTGYDSEMRSWDDPAVRRNFRRWAGSFPVYDAWRTSIEWVRIGKLVTWDVAWCWAVFQDQGLAVMPRVSLIRNIGFGLDSTNTFGGDERAQVIPGRLAQPFVTPRKVAPDLHFQRRLDKKEFWRADDTLAGRLRIFARAVKRSLLARQS